MKAGKGHAASLRARLLIAGLSIAVLAMAASGFATYAMLSRTLEHDFDAALIERAKTLASTIEIDEGRIEFEFDTSAARPGSGDDVHEYWELRRAQGAVVARAPTTRGQDLPQSAGDEPGTHEPGSAARCFRGTLPGGEPGRVAEFRWRPRVEREVDDDDDADLRTEASRRAATTVGSNGADARPSVGSSASATFERSDDELILALARPTTAIRATLASFRTILIAVSLAVALLSIIGWSVVVARGLSPLSRLTQRVATIDEHRLGARLDAPQAPAELRPLIETLNALLARLEAAFQREKSWSADIAHELRTPLSALRSTIEVALSIDDAKGPHRQALDACLVICEQTQRTIETLLTLARADAGLLDCLPTDVDLAAAIDVGWRSVAARASERQLDVQIDVNGDALPIRADRGLLDLILRNLFDNATHYTPIRGRIRIGVEEHGSGYDLTVANSGSQISRHDATLASERFWRRDPARSENGIHCGLGLALVESASTLQGASVEIESEVGGDFIVRVAFTSADGIAKEKSHGKR